MDIGFVNFNQEERNKVYKIMQLIRESQAIDELGIGRVRDAFSNLMFPGTSTLQKHAKYFAIMPSLYHQAIKEQYSSRKDVAKKITEWEINITQQLLNGTEEGKRIGITGSDTLQQAKSDYTKFVKYDPTYIYFNGMQTFEMMRLNGNIYDLIFEQSKIYHENPKDYDAGTSDLSGDRQLFVTCGEQYDFKSRTNSLSLTLTEKEARYIQSHITQAKNSKESLLAYLLRENVSINDDDGNVISVYDALQNIKDWKKLPEKYAIQYKLSLRFSRFINALQWRYKYIFDTWNASLDFNDSVKEEYNLLAKEDIDNYSDMIKGLTTESIKEAFSYINSQSCITDNSIETFCYDAIGYIEKNDESGLDNLIKKREKKVKDTRCKLNNPEYKGKKHIRPSKLDYRWSLVHVLISEIREAK